MVLVQVYCHVHVDDVARLELTAVGNAVTYAVIDGRAHRLREKSKKLVSIIILVFPAFPPRITCNSEVTGRPRRRRRPE